MTTASLGQAAHGFVPLVAQAGRLGEFFDVDEDAGSAFLGRDGLTVYHYMVVTESALAEVDFEDVAQVVPS